MDAIRTVGLTRRFGETVAVDDLTLTVAPGELFGLVGPDGAGKTTVMRLLAAILAPSGGTATVLGHDVARAPEAVKLHLGYMSQRFGLYPDLTVAENLRFYADLHEVPRRQRQERLARLLAFSQLGPFQERLAGRLSGGMKQKLGLACALIHEPRLLLLDEPTNGVDPVSRREFWRILYQLLQQGVTIFVATAYLDEAERCRRIALLHQGRLLACDTPAAVKRRLVGQMVEWQFDQARAAAALLRERWPAAVMGLYGDRVHLLAPDAAWLTQARAALAAAGYAPAHERPCEPSLEDVLVAALRQEAEVPHAGT
jgi:ABC-2 type transport system ATP-binding protein